MKNPQGEGNRKDGEGQRGESFQVGRGRTSGERAREQDRDSRETTLNVLFSIFVRSTGTRAGTTVIQLMIRVELHKDYSLQHGCHARAVLSVEILRLD